ncbi:hypothetical protein I6H67_05080 [Pediococcus pentosaceus]|uniref:hypothetical protein n=1 Tax=Pediococcus pentosaceus TaxID=1255 RepID=UPI0018E17722|nr:hypothetical protein [Pediococcus pentosaceus]QQC60653.1 hypothetical protein I6H67_05080 [Pediococcus pentosaceus]
MAINLDSKLQTVKEFVVGGKTRKVVYDDKFMAAIAEADIRIGKDLEKYIDPDEETIEEFNKKQLYNNWKFTANFKTKLRMIWLTRSILPLDKMLEKNYMHILTTQLIHSMQSLKH